VTTLWVKARSRLGAVALEQMFRGLARLGRLHPQADEARHGVEVIRDVPYVPSGLNEHLLDVYRPVERRHPRPVVLYLHGGAFRILSKDTHWLMGLVFARSGYVVFNANYRLAPRHRFPAAIEDACRAALWVKENAARFGGDPDRLVLAGESAGGNLATSLALASAYRRPEPFARAVFDAGVQPRAVIAACGLLQVSDIERFRRRRKLPAWVYDRMAEASYSYLGKQNGELARASQNGAARALDLADPLVALERGQPPDRPLPPFYAFCGTRDPLLDDTRRLGKALEALGVPCETRVFPGEVHAFHALAFRAIARDCWRCQLEFLTRHVAHDLSRSALGPDGRPRAATSRDSGP
jgi:acetyl esterase